MKKSGYLVLLSLLLSWSHCVMAQGDFYHLDSVRTIEVRFAQNNWDYQLDTAKLGSDGYVMAQWVTINGTRYDSVGVKYKGNSSYDSTYKKNPLHISLGEFKNQAYHGMDDIKLSNGFGDPSLIREVLAYHILKNYMHCPQSNFVKLYINDLFIGVYSNSENIDKKFCSDHFYSSKRTFVKCNPMVVPSTRTKSNLKYISADSADYKTLYELKSEEGWKELINLCDTITNHPAAIDKIVDIDRVLWMLAFNVALVNLDSYSGAFAQNYYLYRDKTRHFNPIVWDLNMSFGAFPFLGYSNTSLGSLPVANMQQLPLNIHETDVYWPLIKAVMANVQYKRKYAAHVKTILNEFITNGAYKTAAAKLQASITSAVTQDTNKFFSDDQFKNGLTQNVNFSSYTVPGIANLMDARATYLLSTAELKAVAPTVSAVGTASLTVSLDSAVTMYAKVKDASEVFLNYRYDREDNFIPVSMYDDGMHNDSLAGDGWYGASFTMKSRSAQFYVYAENSAAGSFSPARAEHEFYSINASAQEIAVGELVINEFLASNKTGETDETGKYEDWIELYNNSDHAIHLFGHYLSDNRSNLEKFTFPRTAVIAARQHMVVWADEDSSTQRFVHCNFKLSGNGEAIYLTSASGKILDSVVFNVQTDDVSLGRCPNGLGSFASLGKPTFQAVNDCQGVDAVEGSDLLLALNISPNPANDELTVLFTAPVDGEKEASVYNMAGTVIYKTPLSAVNAINTSTWSDGIYVLRVEKQCYKIVVIH